MESLAVELASMLKITVDKAIELLPVIRQQFIIYNIIQQIGTPILIIASIGVILTIIVWIMYVLYMGYLDKDDKFYEYERETAQTIKKFVAPVTITTVIFVILKIGIQILKYVYTPDFMLIKEFLIK